METQQGIHPVVLPPMGNLNPEQVALKSLTHWVWTPFKKISNMGPFGIRSQLGYRDQRWTEFERCVPYPLGNLVSSEPDRQVVAEAHASGFSLGPTVAPTIETVKYAQEQAAELGQIYGEEGLRVLVPLIGMNDAELVGQIIQVVQPFAYPIHEMQMEFTAGAEKRIAKSNLSPADQVKAWDVAKIMRNGAEKAETKALAEYESLISSMSDKSVGQPGIANPNKHHLWICAQLNKPEPKRVNRMEGGSEGNEAINILAKRALREESAAESMATELEEERAARKALEERLAKLEELATGVKDLDKARRAERK